MKPTLDDLAQAQDAVARREQLRAIGVGREAVRTQIRSRRWRALGSMVVVLHNGPLSRRQQEWAAVLSAGRDAGLAGLTALDIGGLRGWEDEAVHVLVPRGRTPPRIDGLPILVHETRWPSDGRLPILGRPPRTRVDRAAVDAGGWMKRPRAAGGLLAAVVQQRLTTASRLSDVLRQAGPIRHAKAMRHALADIGGGAEALSEIDFTKLCRRHRLGTVTHQAVRYDGAGLKRYLDAVIEAPSGARVACEVDGAVHLFPLNYWQDMFRANELVIAGEPLLRFPTIAVRHEPERVADQIRRALAAQEARARVG